MSLTLHNGGNIINNEASMATDPQLEIFKFQNFRCIYGAKESSIADGY